MKSFDVIVESDPGSVAWAYLPLPLEDLSCVSRMCYTDSERYNGFAASILKAMVPYLMPTATPLGGVLCDGLQVDDNEVSFRANYPVPKPGVFQPMNAFEPSVVHRSAIIRIRRR